MLKKIRKSMKVIERKIYESYCITLVRKDAREEALKNTSNFITSVKNTHSGGGDYTEIPTDCLSDGPLLTWTRIS